MKRVGYSVTLLAICVVIVGLTGNVSWSQGTSRSQVIRDITVEGNIHTTEDEVLRAIETAIGDDLNDLAVRRQLSNDLKALARLGYFEEFGVSIAEEPMPDGVRLIFIVDELPLIRNIDIQGNDTYIKNDRKLRKEMEYRPGDRVFLSPQYVERRSELLRQYYRKKGFPLTEEDDITWDVRDLGNHEVELVFTVEEGQKRKITQVVFRNPNRPDESLYFTQKFLRKNVPTKESWWFISRKYDEEKIAQALIALERLYRSEGFLDVVIERGDLEQDPENPKGLILVYEIQEGVQYRLEDVIVRGNAVFSTEEIMNVISSVPGEPLDEIKFRFTDDLPAVRELYWGQGYMNARIGLDYEKSTTEGTVDAIFDIREQGRVRLNDILIRAVVYDPDTGEKIEDQLVEDFTDDRGKPLFKTKRYIIERELDLNRGDIIDWGEVKEAERRLQSLGYFERFLPFQDTGFEVQPTEDPEEMDLVLRAQERRTGQIGFGGGWSTAFGFTGFVGLREENLFGRGQIFDISLELGQRRESYRMSFTEPRFLGTDYSLGFDVYNTVRRSIGNRDFDEERLGAAIRSGKQLTRYWSAGWQIRGEQVDVSDFASGDIVELPELYEEARGEQTTFSVLGSLTYENLDYRPRPRRGHLDSISIQVADFGGDNEFVKLLGEANYYHPAPFWDRLVFAFRQEVGYGVAFGGSSELPLHERFYEGGINSVRGFETYSLGPKGTIHRTFWQRNARGEIVRDLETGEPVIEAVDEDEVNLGGEFKSVTNAELRYHVTDMVTLAYFVDAGYAWETISDFDPGDFRVSTGVSLQLDLPLGFPVRFDLGFPLRTEDGDDEELFSFSFYRQFR